MWSYGIVQELLRCRAGSEVDMRDLVQLQLVRLCGPVYSCWAQRLQGCRERDGQGTSRGSDGEFPSDGLRAKGGHVSVQIWPSAPRTDGCGGSIKRSSDQAINEEGSSSCALEA
jgi:hypothetical protein